MIAITAVIYEWAVIVSVWKISLHAMCTTCGN